MKVLGLTGSLRAGSHSRRLMDAVRAALPAGARLHVWEHLAELPAYDEDVDAETVPVAVEELRAAITEADALLIVTPEYNGSVPGGLKNAVDWASRPRGSAALVSKPVAVVAHSPSPNGGQWAAQDLVRVLGVAGAQPLEDPFSVPTIAETLPDGERVLRDPALQEGLGALLARLIEQTALVAA